MDHFCQTFYKILGDLPEHCASVFLDIPFCILKNVQVRPRSRCLFLNPSLCPGKFSSAFFTTVQSCKNTFEPPTNSRVRPWPLRHFPERSGVNLFLSFEKNILGPNKISVFVPNRYSIFQNGPVQIGFFVLANFVPYILHL